MAQEKKSKAKLKSEDKEIEVLLEDQEKVVEAIKACNKKVEELEKENKELKDASLRAMAEADNIKKRKEKEVQEIRKYALSGFVENLIPIIENLYRSTEHVTDENKKNEIITKITEGIEMTQDEFLKLLEKQGVKRVMPSSGDNFDHNFHQAISTINNGGKPNSIDKVIQAGYLINDRLIRPALVVVNS